MMQRALPWVLVGYCGAFVAYVTIRLTADAVRRAVRRRRFARYLRELQAEADDLLLTNTLRHMVDGA